mgnify:CR=1 FL=1
MRTSFFPKDFLKETFTLLKSQDSFFRQCRILVLQADISSYRRRLSDLEAQCEEQQVQNDEMESLLKKGSDFDYIVKMAREKLGLIFSDEQVFYDAAGNQ